MWERLPIGRPTSRTQRDWEYVEEDMLPTVAYMWDEVSGHMGRRETLYKSYTNEFDFLHPNQVCNVSKNRGFLISCKYILGRYVYERCIGVHMRP